MSARDLAFVLLRGLGLVILILAALGLPSATEAAIEALANPRSFGDFWAVATLIILRFGIGILLFYKSPSLASRFFDSASPRDGLDAESLQGALIGVLGVYFAASGLIDLAGNIWYVRFLQGIPARGPSAGESDQYHWALLVLPLLRASAGVALFFGSRRISASWSKLESKARAATS